MSSHIVDCTRDAFQDIYSELRKFVEHFNFDSSESIYLVCVMQALAVLKIGRCYNMFEKLRRLVPFSFSPMISRAKNGLLIIFFSRAHCVHSPVCAIELKSPSKYAKSKIRFDKRWCHFQQQRRCLCFKCTQLPYTTRKMCRRRAHRQKKQKTRGEVAITESANIFLLLFTFINLCVGCCRCRNYFIYGIEFKFSYEQNNKSKKETQVKQKPSHSIFKFSTHTHI